MKIALYLRNIDTLAQDALHRLVESLHKRGIGTVTVCDGDKVDGCDYLFSIGGDGTLLSSVQFVHIDNPADFPPILGINFGHLGFLTSVGKENLDGMVDDLVEGRFSIEERTLLSLPTMHSQFATPFALNEVFLHRADGLSLLRTRVFVDDEYVSTYAGDGVIVATPTGSTAYSLSCGGPILTPTSGCFVITPIGAHTLTLRPIIVPDSAHLRLVVEGEMPFTIGMDSRRATLAGGTEVSLERAPFTIRLIRMNTQNFFSAIRDKLMWGTEVRQ